MKHLLSFLVLMCVSLSAMASETSVKNAEGVEIWYDFDSNTNTASVTYRGNNYDSYSDEYTGEVVIPSTVTYKGEKYSVTSIGNYAFRECDALTSITLPEGVTSIGYSAFAYCDALTSITIPEGVTSIGNNAFAYCDALTSITIPEGVTSIGNRAFYLCTALTSITLPEGLTSIEDDAFSGCNSLTSITIPDGVTSIGDDAFSGCNSLTSITIPDGVTSIGYEAFAYCDALTSITLPEGLTEIGERTFAWCSSLTSITLLEGLTEIGDYAFYKCDALTSITLPESLTSIGDDAFYDCDALTSITIPEGLTSIGDYAFKSCSSLTSITLPESLTEIGDDAFYNCYKLYEVYNKSDLTITAGNSDNGYVAYYAKNVYTDSEGESKLKTVGDYIFYVDGEDIELIAYTGSETSITLPSDYEGKNYKIGNYAFYECDALTSITIPEGVTSIGYLAFGGCYSLTSITLPESLTSIGYDAFGYCDALTSITLPESLTSIGDYAFYNCSALTSITSKNATPPTIGGSYTFYDVDKSIPVYVPKSSVDAYKSAEYWKDFTNIVAAYFVDIIAENGTVEGAGAHEENAKATLTATPAEGYKFVQWSDGVTDNPRTMTITKDVSLEAIFEKETSTAIENDNVDAVSVRLIGNNIVVEGADDYTVYSVSGQNLGKVESVERGIYIVVVNGKSYKVVAK